jgi:CRP-like cAMP-binding protein
VLAETETRLLVFPRDEILAAMEREPGLFRKYSALLSRQVRDLRSLLEVRSLRSAEERILHFLRLHADANGRYRAAPTLMDLAGHLGLAHETLYRALKRLEKSGRIRRRGLEMFLC